MLDIILQSVAFSQLDATPKGDIMQHEAPTNELILVILAAVLLAGTFRMAEWLIRDLWRRQRNRIIWWNGDTGSLSIEWMPRASAFNKDGKRYLLDGRARAAGPYPTWVIDPETGFNLVAPTRSELVEAGGMSMVAAMVTDPSILHREVVMNRARDSLTANDEPKDPYGWVPVVAGVSAISLLVIVGMLGYFGWKLLQAGSLVNGTAGV